MSTRDPHIAAARIIQDAGGELVGRTRLQKLAYLCQLAGFGEEFNFEYYHFGPFSEDLARGMEIATALGQVDEDERRTDWGGSYSVYSLRLPCQPSDDLRAHFLDRAKRLSAIELELAATAAFLFAVEGVGRIAPGNPWHETEARKPEKARNGRLARAAEAYAALQQISTPKRLPSLPSP